MSEKVRQITNAALIAAPVFEAQQWKWSVRAGVKSEGYVPSVADIARSLARLIDDAHKDTTFAASGRLAIRFDKEDGIEMFLVLGSVDNTE
ncbi:hypothetical protein LCGC14_3139280 [marine sediment metagenome]|uniref:Uncharacterized protein n=1 Tax=marine sediment metagenome TaxID=412755 RepID=A0A0F8WLC4_9ZZZZ